jgi:hypothetical protein
MFRHILNGFHCEIHLSDDKSHYIQAVIPCMQDGFSGMTIENAAFCFDLIASNQTPPPGQCRAVFFNLLRIDSAPALELTGA